MMGANVVTAIETILGKLDAVASIELRSVPAAPSLQDRARVRDESSLDAAKTLSHVEGIPFWHSVFRLGAQSPRGVSEEIVHAALFSQESEHVGFVSTDEHFRSRLATALNEKPEERMLLLASTVRLRDGAVAHLPLLDFSVKQRWDGSQLSAERVARALGIPGVLVASGRSFHYLGEATLSWDDYADFLERALLLTPLVDERWIAHQLRARQATLRLSPNADGMWPTIVAEVRT